MGPSRENQSGQETNEELCFDLLMRSFLCCLHISGIPSCSPSAAGCLFLLRPWGPAPPQASDFTLLGWTPPYPVPCSPPAACTSSSCPPTACARGGPGAHGSLQPWTQLSADAARTHGQSLWRASSEVQVTIE